MYARQCKVGKQRCGQRVNSLVLHCCRQVPFGRVHADVGTCDRLPSCLGYRNAVGMDQQRTSMILLAVVVGSGSSVRNSECRWFVSKTTSVYSAVPQ
jgi:hypothetical protein